jgi:hypothetical protein
LWYHHKGRLNNNNNNNNNVSYEQKVWDVQRSRKSEDRRLLLMLTESRPNKDIRYPSLLKLPFNDDLRGSSLKGPGP